MNKISLLTVDAAGTLLKPWPSVGAVYGKAARKKGISVNDAELDVRFGKAFIDVQIIAQKEQLEYRSNEIEKKCNNSRQLKFDTDM